LGEITQLLENNKFSSINNHINNSLKVLSNHLYFKNTHNLMNTLLNNMKYIFEIFYKGKYQSEANLKDM